MRVFVDHGYATRLLQEGLDAASPVSLSVLDVPQSQKSEFLREDIFQTLRQKQIFEHTASAADADAILMPFTLGKIRSARPDVEHHYRNMAAQSGKPLILEYFGDATDDVDGNNTYILRTSKFRTSLKENEVICPPVIQDIGRAYDIAPTQKPHKPTVGFMGLAKKKGNGLGALFSYGRRDYFISAFGGVLGYAGKTRSGLYFRKKAISHLESDPRIDSDIITRDFWGRGKRARDVIGGDTIRREYVENMRRNLYMLAVRGRGNFSLRFFEILSASRIPLFIDTDMPLPMSDRIDYDSFCIFVDWRDIGTVAGTLSEFHRQVDPDRLIDMQRAARNAFDTHLRFDNFLLALFADILPQRLFGGTSR